jgi:hypothetical protein
LPIALAASLLLFAGPGHGLGFGAPIASAVIVSPLDFVLPPQARAGERFDPACVQVEVQIGDRPLLPDAVRWQVAAGARADERRVQVSTLAVLDEPAVAVLVSSGCQSRVGRRTTLLARLPGPSTPAVAASLGEVPAPTLHRSLATTVKPARTVVATRAHNADGLRLARWLPSDSSSTASAGRAISAVAVAALGVLQRLPSGALAAPGHLAGGVQAALTDAATQAASEQIRLLEGQVQQVLAEARRQQDQLAQLRQRLSTAESANAWLPWLLLGIGVGGMLVAWLGLRVRRLQRELEQGRWTAADGLQASAAEADSANAPLVSRDRPLLSSRLAALSATTPDMTIAQPKMVSSAAPSPQLAARTSTAFSLGTGVPPRPVSVEELLDLDQQVDFFLVLGQEQAAVELLLSHVRSTGGTNALPYFKLLEIYSQKGDDEAYERTRERFNQRFNAFAPAFGGDLMAGRSLEDYPDVVLRLQRAWAQPLRAVAELESLLLRRSDLEPFDLPAYRDVLMLHALVRDLPAGALPLAAAPVPKPALAPRPEWALPGALAEADGGGEADVDLLLPLDDGPLDITARHAQVSERASAQATLADWVFTRTTQPAVAAVDDNAAFDTRALDRRAAPAAVDLDLSEVAPAPREFIRPAAFTDIDQRRDSRLSGLGALDEDDRLPTTSRR